MVKGFFTGKKTTLVILLILVCCSGIVFLFWARVSTMFFLPKGEYIRSSISPDGKYRVNAYVSSPSLSDDAVRCETEDLETGKTRNIYWEYRKSDVKILWLSEETVSINGREINILTEHYDWRKDDTAL